MSAQATPRARTRVPDHGARIAARRIGCTLDEYRLRDANDEAWCSIHRDWHPKAAFVKNASKRNGIKGTCRVGLGYGPQIAKRFRLTPEGEAAVSRADSARSEPAASCAQAAATPSGHITCPPSLRWLCDGPLPFGWVKEADRGSQ